MLVEKSFLLKSMIWTVMLPIIVFRSVVLALILPKLSSYDWVESHKVLVTNTL